MSSGEKILFKGTRDGIVMTLQGHVNFPTVKRMIKDKLSANESFLLGAHVTIDLGQNYLTEDQLDVLAQILAENGLILRKITRSSSADNQVLYFDFGSRSFERSQEEMPVKSDQGKEMIMAENMDDNNTILVKRTLRSGQSLRYPGNIVILGDVNPGGEVVAGGNIIVMGSLRGVAHAGAAGDENSVVTAFRLKPTQLRIANHITRAPDGEAVEPEYPEIASIKNGVVVIEFYQPNIDRNYIKVANKN
ncbi:septum site-determining protein MinC [Desulfitispora alkaliphila]|uniref:septum site-determining protein MinC n=1 Tax=Desulfitispora alkaliphila TaxID=622674 RepID=UPI003D223B85